MALEKKQENQDGGSKMAAILETMTSFQCQVLLSVRIADLKGNILGLKEARNGF